MLKGNEIMPANETAWSYSKRSYLAPFIHWFWLLIVCTLIGALGAFAIAKAQRPVYRATAILFVSQQGASYTGAASQYAPTYATLVDQPVVLQKVIGPFGYSSATELASRVQASSPSGTPLVDVSVDDTNPTRAAALANAVASAFIAVLNAQGASDAFPVSVFQPAVPPSSPDHPDPIRYLLIGGALGLAIAVIAVHALDLLEGRVRTSPVLYERVEENSTGKPAERHERVEENSTGKPAERA